ncbi:uncharacterized protein LOC112568582 [Pomacea canaliculata]|uniref:uncharacterized protein LOC112568582 n=1 Tax=Pomacea canaliculata TaxID=400727 RepID=UPI000D72E928|nr:uncharacterized protein LOC112568582 [Pomacea canaliculata]
MAYQLATMVTPLLVCLIMCHRILALTISSNNEVEELSVNQRSVSCEQLFPNSMVYWSITPLHGQVKQVGMCEGATCTSAYRPNVYPERFHPENSSLVFLNVTREWAGTVVCTESFTNGSEQSVNSTLDVYYNSGITNIRVGVNREDWTLNTSFIVTKIFSALGNYGAEFYCHSKTSKVNVSLVTYNESSFIYNVGYFVLTSFSRPFYHRDEYQQFCAFTILVHPGEISISFDPRKAGQLEEPSTPEADCHLDYVPEEGPSDCICASKFLGSPEGRLRWYLGGELVASGDYGVRRLPLPSDIVNRTHDFNYLECEVEWLYTERSELTIQVAYGPDDVIIKPLTITHLEDGKLHAASPVINGQDVFLPPDDTSEVALVCEARNVEPLKSEMVTWGGLCDGQQGYTCNLYFETKMDDMKEVTCTVTNYDNNDYTVFTSIILKVPDGPETVSIQYHTISTPDKCHVILTCEAPGVKPLTYDMFEWGGMCEGQQGSRCVATADNEKDDGREVTCTVTNHVNHGRTASGSVTLTLSGCESQDLMGKGVGIGVGVTLTLELLVVAVVVVIWRRRRYQRDQMYDKPSQDPNLSMSNTYEMMRAGPDTHTDINQMYDKPSQDPSLSMSNTYEMMRAGLDTYTDISKLFLCIYAACTLQVKIK